MLPSCALARRNASSRDKPRRIRSSAQLSMWNRSSSSICASTALPFRIARHHVRTRLLRLILPPRSSLFGRRLQNCADHVGKLRPLPGLGLKPPPSRRRQPVKACPPLVLALAPLPGDPALVLQPIQGGVERPLLDLQ